MAKQLQLRRGTTSEHASFTGAAGEVTVNTTTNGIVVHDGSTAGGHAVGVGLSGMANVQYFTSSGTFTKPTASNFSFIKVTARGGGGAGGGGNGSSRPTFGGHQGALGVVIIQAAALGSTETVTIGSGGAETTAAATGADGGDTTFGSHITARGGMGGEYSTVNYTFLSGLDNDASGIANGEPAKATGTGVINFGGDLGQPNQYYYNSTSQHQGGHGGGSGAVSGGRNGIAKGDIHGPTDAVGNDGAGGGSSPNCSTTDRSGAGADGYVMIEEFYTQ